MMRGKTAASVAHNWAVKGFVAVDWGSTARRAYLLDPQGGLADQMEDEAGILTIPRQRLSAEVNVLRRRFGGACLLMAGMIGSNRGLVDAPYVPCPAGLSDIMPRLIWVQPGQIAVVPGLSLINDSRADVMRGEEVQALGLCAMGLAPGRATVCHPGTHTKWIELAQGAVIGFRTVMTGELFGLLRRDSIIADLLQNEVSAGPAFVAGVEQGLADSTLGADLFEVRARALLGIGDSRDASSYVSGLLIGSDVASGLQHDGNNGEILVVGRKSLTGLFAIAIRQSGRATREIDGAATFVAGMRAIAERVA